jgi:DNA invertase Pin-like site-specific DNA recombinase|tara:strand:- start:380 stop:1000 length:621 start_codon:yes stop_codon:yes gene_type:complete
MTTGRKKRVGIYLRVSSAQRQTTLNQRMELLDVCKRNDWDIYEIYDETISGTKSIDDRSELKKMLADAGAKYFDMVVVFSVCRMSRSMKHLIAVMTHLDELDCDLYAHQQGIRTDTSMGKMFFQLCGVMAEAENSIRLDRQQIGIKRAQAQGIKFGRKNVVDEDMELRIVELRHKGKSIRAIAKNVGLSVGRVHKVVKEWEAILET